MHSNDLEYERELMFKVILRDEYDDVTFISSF